MAACAALKFLAPACTGQEACDSFHELYPHCDRRLDELGVHDAALAGWVLVSRSTMQRVQTKQLDDKQAAGRAQTGGIQNWLKNDLARSYRLALVARDPANAAAQRSSRSSTPEAPAAVASATSANLDVQQTTKPITTRSRGLLPRPSLPGADADANCKRKRTPGQQQAQAAQAPPKVTLTPQKPAQTLRRSSSVSDSARIRRDEQVHGLEQQLAEAQCALVRSAQCRKHAAAS